MNNTEPTQEQLKKFWEWCGLDLKHRFEVADVGISICSKCGTTKPALLKLCSAPSLTLDNLFKYAVPKLQDMGYQIDIVCLEHKGFSVSPFNVITSSNNIIEEKNDKLVLALFWAIWEVIK